LSAEKGVQTPRPTDADVYIQSNIPHTAHLFTADEERTRWHCAENKEIAPRPCSLHFPLLRVKWEL